jgi:cytochrome c553
MTFKPDRSGRFGKAAAASVLAAAFFVHAGAARADAETGRAKAQVCAACHGDNGNSSNPSIPSLAGQPKQFIVSALYQFREGNRKNPVMSPMAAGLSNADLNDLAAYFSAQKPAAPTRSTSADKAAAGHELVMRNNCAACHTKTLAGQQHIPRLAGQQYDYLKAQLSAFRASTRADMDGVMTSAAQGLSEQDVEVLSDYLSSLAMP